MKTKAVILICLIGAVVLTFAYEYSRAESKTDTAGFKVGVVSVRKVFQECKRYAKYRDEATAERQSMLAELDKLSKEVDAEEAGLKTLIVGSDDYLASWKEILEKKGKLEALRQFYKQQIELKDVRWTEQLYEDILRITGELAAQKGLDLVLESSRPEFPSVSALGLAQTIRTHKLLYSNGSLDITDELIARLDAEK